MGNTRSRWLGAASRAVMILAGLFAFLIGAQLPYHTQCIAPRLPCIHTRLIDLTPDVHTASQALHVSLWYARLAPLLVAILLIWWSPTTRRRASGAVAFSAVILFAVYLAKAMPLLLVAGAWEPAAVLWPIGAFVMGAAALGVPLSRGADGRERPTLRPQLWVGALLAGVLLTMVPLWIRNASASYLFWIGATLIVTGLLATPNRLTAHGEAPTGALRWLSGGSFIAGCAAIAASHFLPWATGKFPFTPIREDFLLHPTRDDFWTLIVMLSVIAAPLIAAIRSLAGRAVSPFVFGGAIAGAYWVFVSTTSGAISAVVVGATVAVGPYVLLGGVVLVWVGALLARPLQEQAMVSTS